MTRIAPAAPLRRRLALTSALGMSLGVFVAPAAAQNLAPSIESSSSGATVVSASNGVAGGGVLSTNTQVSVTAPRAVVNWNAFNVAQGTSATYTNDSGAPIAAILNRVVLPGALNTTTIAGQVTGTNVEVWFSNPNGIVLGPTGNFNTAGLVLTTRTVDPGAFVANTALTLADPNGLEGVPGSGITGSFNQIISNGRVAAFIAPVIRLTGGTITAGAGDVGFVTASDVTISNPGSPLGLTVVAGTTFDSGGNTGVANAALNVDGTITAGNAYFVASAQAGVNALLRVPASVTTASLSNGVVVLGGSNGGTAVGPITVSAVPENAGAVNVQASGALTANGGGAIRVVGSNLITTSGALTSVGGGNVQVRSFGTIDATDIVRVEGAVSSSGTYEVTGGRVVLGTTGAARTQQAVGAVTISALADGLESTGTLSLSADTDGTGDGLSVGGALGIDFLPVGAGNAPATLTSGNPLATNGATSNITFSTLSGAATLRTGNLRAGTLTGVTGRTGAIVTGDLTLAGANTISTTNTLTTGAVATGGTLLLSGAGVATGALSNIGTSTAAITVRSGATGGVTVASSNLAGALTIDAGNLGTTFGALIGGGDKTVLSDAGITSTVAASGVAIGGQGAVSLTAGAADTVSIPGSIGAAGAGNSVASLTLTDGGAVTLGNVFSTGNVLLGQGSRLASLTIGTVRLGGNFTSDTSGDTRLTSIFSSALGSAVDVETTTGVILATNIEGPASKRLVAGSTLDANAILDSGAVTLIAGGAIDVVQIGDVGREATSLSVTSPAAVALGFSGVTSAINGAVTIGTVNPPASPATLNLRGTFLGGSFDTKSVGQTSFGTVTATNGGINAVSTAGSIIFNGAVNGPASPATGALNVTAANGQSVTFVGPVGATNPFSSFISNGNAAVNLNGGSLTTTGTQSYGGLLVLGADTVLTGTGATFTGGINGAGGGTDHNLRLDFSADQTLTGTGVSGVRDLTVGAGGITTLNGTIATSGAQLYNDSVVLAGGTVTVQSSGTGDAGNITFANTVNGTAANANALTVSTPTGTLRFANTVGATTSLAAVTATNLAAVQLRGASVTTGGTQAYGATGLDGTGNVTLNAGTGNVSFTGLNGPRGLTVNTSGTTTLPGGGSTLAFITTDAGGTTSLSGIITTTGGDQTYNDAVVLTNDTTLAGARAIFAAGLTGGGANLTLATTGAQELDGTVTGVNNLRSEAGGTLRLSGTITTGGFQRFDDAVTLGSDVTLVAVADPITFGSIVNSTNGTQALTTTSDSTTFTADVGTNQALRQLTVNGITVIAGSGTRTIATAGAPGTQTYNGQLQLGTDTVLTGVGASFTAGVDGGANRNLTLTFSGANALGANPFTNLGNLLVNGAGTTTLGGNVTTVGSQTYESALTLGGAAVLTSTGNAAISFATLTGNNSLNVVTTGATTFNAGATGLASIATDADGTTTLNGTLSTTGAQNYGDDVVLGSATTVRSTGAGALTFGGTVTGAQALTIDTSGQTTFTRFVGTIASLDSVGTGAVRLNGGGVTTTGAQSYNGQLQLGADTVLTGLSGTFTGGIDGDVSGTASDLTLNFADPTTIDGTGFSGVDSLTTGGGGITSLSGTINTLGGQTYNDAVTLTGATVLQSGGGTGTGAISFAATVDGAQALTVTTAGSTSFNGVVGTLPLASLTVDGTGPISLNGGSVTTSGAQSYTGATTLGANTLIATNGGNIGFASTVDGAFQLSVRTGPGAAPVAGTVNFGGALGSTSALNGLAVRANSATAAAGNRVGTLAAVVNSGGFVFADLGALTVGTVDGLSGLQTGTGAAAISAGALLSLAANIDSGGATLTGNGIVQNAGTAVNAGAGAVTLDGNDGAITLIGALTTTNTGASAIRVLDAGTVQIGPTQTGAGGTLTLGGAGNDALGSVGQLAGTAITAGTLTGNVTGAATLTNANAIGTLGGFTAGALALRTTGSLIVNGAVDTGAGNLTLTADGGPIALQAGLTSAGTVTLASGGAISQTAAGFITAATLTGAANGPVTLTAQNAVGTLAGFTVLGGGLQFVDTLALAVTANVTTQGVLQLTAPGINFTGQTLTATAAVTLNAQTGALVGNAVAGSDVSGFGDTIGIGTATAGATPSGMLTLTAQNGLTLGTGTAGQAMALSTVSGPLTVSGALTAGTAGNVGSVTSITTSSGGPTSIASATSNNGTIGLTTTGAGSALGFGTLDSTGAKTLVSAGGIAGGSIAGAGSVALTAAAGSAITVSGTIGTTATPAASLAINGGGLVTLGTDPAAIAVATAGDVLIGQSTAVGALVVKGGVVTGGQFAATASGSIDLDRVSAATTLAATSTGGAVDFDALNAPGATTLTAATSITGNVVDGGGALRLTAGTASPITIGSIGATVAAAALTVSGGSVAMFGTTGATGTSVNVAGATNIGQAPGSATGALTVNGSIRTGSLNATTTGPARVQAVNATGAVALNATGGDIDYATIDAAGITLTAGGAVRGGMLTSSGAVGVVSGGLTAITGGTSAGDFAVAAGGAATISGAVAAGGAYRVRGNAVALGTGTLSQAARGLIDVTATAGGITASNGLTLQSNSDGAGAEYLVLDATGPIAFGGATLLGGTAAQRSDIGILQRGSGQAVTLGVVTGRSLTGVNAARTTFGTLTNAGDITATGAITTAQSLALTSTGGAISLQTVDVTATGQGIALTTSAPGGGAIGAIRLTAPGSITVDARGATQVTTITGASGSVRGATVDVGSVNVGTGTLGVTSTAGLLRLNTATAGATTLNATGPLEVTTSLTASGATAIAATGDAALRQVRVSAGALTVDAGGAVSGGGTARADLAATGTGGNVTVRSGTSALLGPIVASDSGGTATLTVGTTLDASSIVAGGAITTTSAGASTIGSVQSKAASVTVTGLSAAVTTADAAGALAIRSTGGAVSLTTGRAGGTATLAAVGPGANGAAGTLTSADLSATGAATLSATGAANLGRITSGAGVTVTAASITAGQTSAGGALSMTATGAITLTSTAQAAGDATFDAGGTASLGQVTAGAAAAISVRALEVAIAGTQRAARVTFTNRAPTTQAIRLGDGAAGGFALSTVEVNNVEAAQLTIDGGAGNVEIGTLAFDADAGRTRVDVLATGRIDVSGAVSGSGTGGSRTFRFGGTAANTADKAGVIRVMATPSAGGRLMFDTADVDLRGGRIGVGQASGFLDPIGFGPGATPLSAAQVGSDFVGNPNSSLYNAALGGQPYAAGTTLLSARSLTVRFTDYALFQNTGVPGTNSGVALGSATAPSAPALILQGPGGTATSAFAIYGTINGISGTATAVSGSSVIEVSGVDLANTRVNGCLAGSGAGCLTAVVSQPLLTIFDSSRITVFRAADDLALPFDPVVGTNNEALFSGFGLIDSPITDTECSSDTTNPACGQNQEQGK